MKAPENSDGLFAPAARRDVGDRFTRLDNVLLAAGATVTLAVLSWILLSAAYAIFVFD